MLFYLSKFVKNKILVFWNTANNMIFILWKSKPFRLHFFENFSAMQKFFRKRFILFVFQMHLYFSLVDLIHILVENSFKGAGVKLLLPCFFGGLGFSSPWPLFACGIASALLSPQTSGCIKVKEFLNLKYLEISKKAEILILFKLGAVSILIWKSNPDRFHFSFEKYHQKIRISFLN